jgi:hypothetical protein
MNLKPRSLTAGIVAAIAVAGAAWTAGRRNAAPSGADARASTGEREPGGSPETAELALQIARVQKQVSGLQRQARAAIATAPTQAVASATAPPNHEELERAAVARMEARRALLARSFELALRDAPGSEQALTQLTNALGGQAHASRRVSADCKQALCRVEIEGDPRDAEQAMAQIAMALPWQAETWMQLDPTTGRALMYVTRGEHRLPQPEENGPSP